MSFLGIDLGTGGVRCLLVEHDGTIRSESSQELGTRNLAREAGRSEQDPREWVLALEGALDHLFFDPANRDVRAVAVDSTSGTVLPVSRDGNPLGMALLYDDMRATETGPASVDHQLHEDNPPSFVEEMTLPLQISPPPQDSSTDADLASYHTTLPEDVAQKRADSKALFWFHWSYS